MMKCKRCDSEVTTDKEYVTDGYFAACLECDQDLFSFEVDITEEEYTIDFPLGNECKHLMNPKTCISCNPKDDTAIMLNHLINIVDMYINEEERHYAESIPAYQKDHIFHDLLAVSLWIKKNHTMEETK